MKMDPFALFATQFWGSYCFLLSLGLLFRNREIQQGGEALLKSAGCQFVASAFSLFFGLALVLLFPTGSAHEPWLLTFFAWATLTKGLLGLYFPQAFSLFSPWFLHHRTLQGIGGIHFLLGCYLLQLGFFS